MKLLSVIIAHPLRKVSGATNAGLQLSQAVAQLTDTEVALMWDRDEVVITGDLVIRRLRCTNRLGVFTPLVPRFVRVPLYDSRIPDLLRDGGYDLVHIHNLVPTLAAARLARACKRQGIPYVVSTHGFFELSTYSKINGFGKLKSLLVDLVLTRPFHQVVRGAERILALSDREGEMLAKLGVCESKTDIVTNGVNEYFLERPGIDELEAVRSKFSLGAAPILLFFGSLHAYKGVGVYLESLKRLKQPFQAVVAGRFKSADEPENLLQAAGISEEMRKQIVFTGEVSDEDLRALYRSADVFVYPTMGDTLPLVVLEAMACELPIVSTTVGGIPFAVTADCGILTPPGDPDATAQAVTTMLESLELRKRAGAHGRARVLSTFRWKASADCALKAYDKAVAAELLLEQAVYAR